MSSCTEQLVSGHKKQSKANPVNFQVNANLLAQFNSTTWLTFSQQKQKMLRKHDEMKAIFPKFFFLKGPSTALCI